ncbi:uncharacterized protein LOC107805798 [Nicotiana tabacum]|uniref:Uncharacterized protein LOC107805798 n=6 Tax=Nicotiana TaxID=4085 RepID=A0AC58UK73_TOBAC|nr:PREDICTED: uncharacterized protein LOC104247479 isoform X1 [Nicotiana sylvestris]XP_009801805.1 PREDICTED: uncharacterized protein LOC104247479 isoform X1 [Nicotiana sylvestris]XP_009801806.1 PREDICTED: uncharacterized protein LOC104247479 isoform X1 [Nicotiana sylvestris]XP_009801807.1 PREDICTED: uncharacterized protein LOC104247479 isoform X1 [Nicotiana sylvestris]XP_009801808.1 PREDICTED: uncharacterized protein LOC104247479 isoform X1 [Nicotiana sylvestris]XP_009801809.1 PREDICTED: unch
MSSGEVKKVSREDIQLVQNLIERCLQLYMNQKEVVNTLLHQAKIEPDFTELVWQKLEEENQEFFRAYYLRLIVKDQIQKFNDLLQRQVEAMQMYATGSVPISNGSQIQPVPQNPTWEATEHAGQNVQLENMHQTINGNSPHIYTNGASPVQSYVQAAIDVSAHARRFDVSPSMLLSQSSNLGMMQGPNDGMIKSVGYSGDSCFLYGSDSNVLEARPGIGDPSVPPFSNVGSNSQALNGNGLGADTSSFGFLGQIPRNFSLSDLTADFTNSSDILEGYSGSAFLATDTSNFLDPQGRAEHQDINGLDNISEGLSYEDFSSD